jgi:hypothetical protein
VLFSVRKPIVVVIVLFLAVCLSLLLCMVFLLSLV